MEDYVKSKLKTKVFKRCGSMSGCVNTGNVYETDEGRVFVKCNSSSKADVMFKGEYESLKTISETETVRVPKPFLVGEVQKEHFIVMEFLDMKSLSKYSSQLGESLAHLHLHNIRQINNSAKKQSFVGFKEVSVDEFGFRVPTSCGYIPQNNEWSKNWVDFYTRQKLNLQINLVLENTGNREIIELWSQLQLKIPLLFKDIEIKPSLLHGDLWIGNSGETQEGAVVFDPASFYGHHEYDLAIAAMFGGFGKAFFNSYHSLIPKENGFQQRHNLYLLFHHLNHWNHFGSHKASSLQLIRDLVKGT